MDVRPINVGIEIARAMGIDVPKYCTRVRLDFDAENPAVLVKVDAVALVSDVMMGAVKLTTESYEFYQVRPKEPARS